MVDFSNSKNKILKQHLQDFAVKFYSDGNYNVQKREELSNNMSKKLGCIFDACDNDKSNSLELEEIALFFKKVESDFSTVNSELKKFFSESDNNRIDKIGNFSYSAQEDNTDTLTAFDKYYKYNEFKYDKNKLNQLKTIKEMLEKGELSFEDGLSEKEIESLFSLTPDALTSLINQEYLPEIMKQHRDLDVKIVEHLSQNDFSAFNYFQKTSIINLNELAFVIDSYKEKYGKSIYNDLIFKYENKEITEELFIKNMKTLLKLCIGDSPTIKDFESSLDLYRSIYNKIRDNKFNLDELKIFDFEQLVSYQFEYKDSTLKKNSAWKIYSQYNDGFDLKQSSASEYLPIIKENFIAENKKIQLFNDEQYTIEYQKDKIKITDNSGKKYIVDFNKILKNVKDKDDKLLLISNIKNLPAPILIDLSLEIKDIYVHYKMNNSIEGIANSDEDCIELNLAHNTDIALTIAHELGHRLDFLKDKNITDNINFLEIYNEENEKFKKEYKYDALLIGYANNPKEFFAECYALLNLGSSCFSNYQIANYYPKSLALVKELIEHGRQIPLKERLSQKNKETSWKA